MAYTDVLEVKAYLGIRGAEEDAMIGAMIRRAQARIDTICRTTFEAPEDTTRVFECGDMGVWFDQPLAQAPEGGSPLTSIAVDGVALTPEQYTLKPRNDWPRYWMEFEDSAYGGKTVSITGRWAWSVEVPPDVNLAAVRLAGYYHEARKAPVYQSLGSDDFGGERTVPRAEPSDVLYLLKPYRFTPLLDS